MATIKRSQFSRFLLNLAESLDIPESRYVEAEQRYKAVGTWLGKNNSPLAPFDPEIFPQGSFRLGTVIKPISEADEYDIDLVCELRLSKNKVSQADIKRMVGDRLKEHETYRQMLDKEGRRCWTLNYAESAKFHMDILPAIPDDEEYKRLLLEYVVSTNLVHTAICITDNTLENYGLIDHDWPRSNPKGYADWFKGCMKTRFDERRRILAEAMRAEVEDVSEYKVKTPLQRAIQILKRHRDMMFQYDQDDKPISIIITTLAAHAYNNEDDLLDALVNIVQVMADHILTKDGVSWVPNPVNPFENFADKWQEHPQREIKLRTWLGQVQADIVAALDKIDFVAINESLAPRFGAGITERALAGVGLLASATTASVSKPTVPHVHIKEPSKPWGVRD